MRRLHFFQLPHRLVILSPFLAVLALFSGVSDHARAASRIEVEGAQIRLDAVEQNGQLQGAISIDLKPGWKTYWTSPGPVGLAPVIDLNRSSGIEKARILFPAPARFHEGDVESIGYDAPVSFVIAADVESKETPTLRADLTLGLCRELCLPVRIELDAKPSASLDARAAVRRAFEALPAERPGNDIKVSLQQDRLHITSPMHEVPSPVDAFVAAPEGWSFGAPMISSQANGLSLDVPVLSTPGTDAELTKIDLVLTNGEKADLIRALPVGRN